MPLRHALEIGDSRDWLSAQWTDLGPVAVGSREWRLHPHVFLLVVCLLVVIFGDASEAGSRI